ncbi:hypothetical protein EES38_04605 [Vibrio viridaestus]|uniref:Uncharacterized protein n=1 Tax=Vibrio viridaestus TaxID=2487322 RepID=A0A3N9U2W7_9VIBR|nr:hypothetical protein EES38_04605 [Vibrio viridaestus]
MDINRRELVKFGLSFLFMPTVTSCLAHNTSSRVSPSDDQHLQHANILGFGVESISWSDELLVWE